MDHQMQIGEVAEATGLSLRTIRHYEEVGLVVPAARTRGGFRLYGREDVARLRLIRSLKPLDLTLEEVRDLLGVLDSLAVDADDAGARQERLDRLAMYQVLASERVRALSEQLLAARGLVDHLAAELQRHRGGQPSTPSPRQGPRPGPAG